MAVFSDIVKALDHRLFGIVTCCGNPSNIVFEEYDVGLKDRKPTPAPDSIGNNTQDYNHQNDKGKLVSVRSTGRVKCPH